MFTEQKFISKEFKSILCDLTSTPLFVHNGTYNYQIVNASLISLKQYIESHLESKQVIRRVYSILVECIENIYRHGFAFENKLEFNTIYGFVILTLNKDSYSIYTGNFIKNTEIEHLSKTLNNVIIAENADLKGDYNYILDNNELSEKQGMGLGIIDIALRSKEPIKYKTITYNKDVSFFILEVTVTKKK